MYGWLCCSRLLPSVCVRMFTDLCCCLLLMSFQVQMWLCSVLMDVAVCAALQTLGSLFSPCRGELTLARNVTPDLLIWEKLFPDWTKAFVVYLSLKWWWGGDGKVGWESGGSWGIRRYPLEGRERGCCIQRALVRYVLHRHKEVKDTSQKHPDIQYSDTDHVRPWPLPQRPLQFVAQLLGLFRTHTCLISIQHVNHTVYWSVNAHHRDSWWRHIYMYIYMYMCL